MYKHIIYFSWAEEHITVITVELRNSEKIDLAAV